MAVYVFETYRAIDFWNRRNQLNFPEIIQLEHNQIMKVPMKGSWEHFENPRNCKKNRYVIPCWDYNRVVLDIDNADYIHANYVDGFEDPKKFICTQDPMKETSNDFWKMIWQENSRIIVMLTNVHAKNKEKELCYQYWNLNKDYVVVTEDFMIQTVKTSEHQVSTMTTLRVTKISSNESRYVSHFQYKDWPTGGTPSNHVELIKFIKFINKKRKKILSDQDQLEGNPVVVHCRDGVKKSGLFCAIDISLSELVLRNTVSLMNTVIEIRQQRHSSISSSDDYLYYNQVIMYYCIFYMKL